jgi:hypothetical protein
VLAIIAVTWGRVAAAATEGVGPLGTPQLIREGVNINEHELNPYRDLILERGRAEVRSGTTIDLTNGRYLQPVAFPFGFAYGLLDGFELGVDTAIEINRPSFLGTPAVIDEPHVYGRFALLPDHLALEASVFIPVSKTHDRLGYRIEAPARVSPFGGMVLRGAATYTGYFGGSLRGDDYVHIAQIGGAAIYRFQDHLWASVEVGLTLYNFNFDHAQVPLGFAVGYELVAGLAVMPGFRFSNAGDPSSRVLQVLLVYGFDMHLFGGGGEATPPIPGVSPLD